MFTKREINSYEYYSTTRQVNGFSKRFHIPTEPLVSHSSVLVSFPVSTQQYAVSNSIDFFSFGSTKTGQRILQYQKQALNIHELYTNSCLPFLERELTFMSTIYPLT